MYKYKLEIRQPIYINSVFDRSNTRVAYVYAAHRDIAERIFKQSLRKEASVVIDLENYRVTTDREFLYDVTWMGEVQHEVSYSIVDDNGRVFNSTNTVKDVDKVINWLVFQNEGEHRGMTPFKIEVKEVLIKETT